MWRLHRQGVSRYSLASGVRGAGTAMGRLRQAESRINDRSAPQCRVCGAPTAPRFAFEPYVVVVCRNCGLGQLDPIPTADELDRLYSSADYFEGSDRSGYADYAEQRKVFAMTFRAKLQLLLRHGPVADLLEIGCGPGFFLEVAREAGVARAVGVDRNPWAIEIARRAGLDARVGSIEQFDESASFDAVAMLDVIEHIPDPAPFLAAVRRRLRPGGRLLIMTPNLCSTLARFSGRRWVSFKIPEHVLYFTPGSLARVLAQSGFRVLHVRGTGQYVTVAFFLDRLQRIAPRFVRVIAPPLRGLRALDRVIYIPNGSIDVVAAATE